MPNYVHPLQIKFNKARRALEKALEMIEAEDCGVGVTALQSLNVTDEMAEIFKQKPVILIQSMNVRILITKHIYSALRCFDEIDMKLYREAILQQQKEQIDV